MYDRLSRLRSPLARTCAAGALLFGMISCSMSPDEGLLVPHYDSGTAAYRIERAWNDRLVQQLYLSATELASGDTLALRSLLINRGTKPVTATWRVCGLTIRSEMQMEEPFILCAAHSATGAIAPGDTVITEDAGRIHAAPGVYTLEVQHLIHPPRTLTVAVTVRAP